MAVELKHVKKGERIFGEGTYAQEMYEIKHGKVGIFKDYGKPSQTKLAELTEGYFGEMGLIRCKERTADAAALEDTDLVPISLETMESYFKENDEKVQILMHTISSRLRNMDVEYMKACECLNACREAEESGNPVPEEILQIMKSMTAHI